MSVEPGTCCFRAASDSEEVAGKVALARPTCLLMSERIRREIVLHLESCLPLEGVGLLAVADADGAWMADRYYAGRNADRSPTRFTMEPADVAVAMADMARRRTRLGAVVHSHPRTLPVPSAFDLAEASLPGVLSVIVGFVPRVTIRAWQLPLPEHSRAGIDEILLRTVSSESG